MQNKIFTPMKSFLSKLAAIFFLLMLAAVQAFGQDAPATPKARVLHPVFDFSKVVAGTDVIHPFAVHNPGPAPLHILGVHSG